MQMALPMKYSFYISMLINLQSKKVWKIESDLTVKTTIPNITCKKKRSVNQIVPISITFMTYSHV